MATEANAIDCPVLLNSHANRRTRGPPAHAWIVDEVQQRSGKNQFVAVECIACQRALDWPTYHYCPWCPQSTAGILDQTAGAGKQHLQVRETTLLIVEPDEHRGFVD